MASKIIKRTDHEEVVKFLLDKSVKQEKAPTSDNSQPDVKNIQQLVNNATDKAVKLKFQPKK